MPPHLLQQEIAKETAELSQMIHELGHVHEISNPIGFLVANLSNLNAAIEDLFTLVDAYRGELLDHTKTPETDELAQSLDLGNLREDVRYMLEENRSVLLKLKQKIESSRNQG